jgi:hypothetical protein
MDLPGHLKIIYSTTQYLDLLYKSKLNSDHKLVGTLVARTCSYDKNNQLQLSAITNYSIGRLINRGPEKVQQLLDDLVEYGWLFDTGRRIGARKIFALTFSLIPLG